MRPSTFHKTCRVFSLRRGSFENPLWRHAFFLHSDLIYFFGESTLIVNCSLRYYYWDQGNEGVLRIMFPPASADLAFEYAP